jgi:hypothetical protein
VNAPLTEATAVRLAEALERLVSLLESAGAEREMQAAEPPARVLPKGRRRP